MEDIIMKEVCEVYLRDLATNDVYFLGINTKNDINQKVKQDPLRGGIGGKLVAMLQSDKEIDFSVVTTLHSDNVWAIQSGDKFSNGTYTVQKNERVPLRSGKLAITGTAKGTAAIVIDKTGKQLTGTIATGQVTITGGVEGDVYTVIYPSDVTGNILPLDATKFPHNYYVEMHTIAHTRTNVVVGDVFYIFNNAMPDGNFKAQHEVGKHSGDEMKFSALVQENGDEIGKYIFVPRTA